TKFQISNFGTRVPGFAVTTNGSFNSDGLLNIVLTTGTAGQNFVQGDDVALVDFDITVVSGTANGSSPLDIQANNGGFVTSINGGNATLSPPPTNADNDPNIDGGLQVVSSTARIFVPPTTNASPGATGINVPVSIQVGAVGFQYEAGQFNLEFDPTKLQ